MISCRNVSRRFGDFTAVHNVTFEVEASSICAFLGPNGAGKSTTLKILAGLLAPTSGELRVAGLDAAKPSPELKRRIGVLPEDLGLFDDLTLEEHLLLTGSVYGLSRDETRKRGDELLRTLDLDRGRDTFAGQASHGMRKKTALAMALLHAPGVLLLDEPFEGVDPVTSKVIRELLADAARRGITVFLTSHILSVVEQLATQLIIIRHGTIVWNSSLNELPRSLEEHYLELIEPPAREELAWLRSDQS